MKLQFRKSVKDFSKLLFSNILVRLISIIGIAIYARYTNKTELSVLPLYEIIGGMSMMIFNLGIPPYLVKTFSSFLKESKEKASSLVRTSYSIIIPGIFLFSALVFFYSDFIAETFFNYADYSDFIKIFSFGFIFVGINNINHYLFWASGRFGKDSVIQVVTQLSRTIMGLSLFLIFGLKGLVAGLVISSVITALFSSYYVRDLLLTGRFDKKLLVEMLKDSYPFYFEGYLMYFRRQGDQLVISTFLGPELLAIYFISKRIYEVFSSVLQMLEKVITQSLSRVKDSIEEFSQKISEIIDLCSAIIFPIIFLGIGLTPVLLPLLVGDGYTDSIIPSIILTLGLLIDFVWRTTIGRAVFFLEKSWNRFKITMVDTFFLFSFLLVLAKLGELIGVAVSRVLANIAAGIYTYFKVRKILTIKIDYPFVSITLISSIVMSSIILIAFYFYQDNILFMSISVITGIIIFAVMVSIFISKKYYRVINSFLPIKIKDPFGFLSLNLLKEN